METHGPPRAAKLTQSLAIGRVLLVDFEIMSQDELAFLRGSSSGRWTRRTSRRVCCRGCCRGHIDQSTRRGLIFKGVATFCFRLEFGIKASDRVRFCH